MTNEEINKKISDGKIRFQQTVAHNIDLAVGHCGKCGAPYYMRTGVNMSVLPQQPTPTCICWNLPKVKVSTTGTTDES
jgi:hypothetical protein